MSCDRCKCDVTMLREVGVNDDEGNRKADAFVCEPCFEGLIYGDFSKYQHMIKYLNNKMESNYDPSDVVGKYTRP